MLGSGLFVRAEGLDQIGIARDVIQSVKTRRATFARAIFDSVTINGAAVAKSLTISGSQVTVSGSLTLGGWRAMELAGDPAATLAAAMTAILRKG